MRDIYPKYGSSIFGQTKRSESVVECNGVVFSGRRGLLNKKTITFIAVFIRGT